MIPLTLEYLERIFKRALEIDQRYVAIALQMDGFDGKEIIINPKENILSKLDYYKKTYDEELNHKFAKGIKIIGFTFGNKFEEIYEDLA